MNSYPLEVIVTSRRALTVRTARNKGRVALALGVGTLVFSALLVKVALLLGLISLIAGGALTYAKAREWFQFRAENGLRF